MSKSRPKSQTRLTVKIGFLHRVLIGGAIAVALTVGWMVRFSMAKRPALKVDPDQLIKQAIDRLEHDQPATAAEKLDQLLAQSPHHAKALLFRGQAALMLHQQDAAMNFWNRVPQTSKLSYATACFLKGTVAIERHDAVQAEELFHESLKWNPQAIKSREELVKLYSLQSRSEEVRDQLREIRRVRNWQLFDYAIYEVAPRLIEEPAVAIPKLREFLAVNPRDLASRRGLARMLLSESQWDEVLPLVTTAPPPLNNDPLLRFLAVEAIVGKQPASALDSLKTFWPDGNDANWWYAFGICAYYDEKWVEAARALQFVASERSESFDLLYKLGQALSRLDRKTEAKRLLERANLLEKVFVTSQRLLRANLQYLDVVMPLVLNIASSLLALGEGEEAVWWYELALSFQPQSQEAQAGWIQAKALPAHSQPLKAQPPPSRADIDWGSQPAIKALSNPLPENDDFGIALVDEGLARGLDFTFRAAESGLTHLINSIGGGVAALDYDGDGMTDFFFPQAGPLKSATVHRHAGNALFRQIDGQFQNVALAAGVNSKQHGQGVAAADWNNDGYVDLIVGNYGGVELFANCGDGTFAKIPLSTSNPEFHWTSSLGWGDFDRDGDLDLFIVNYLKDAEKPCPDRNGQSRTCHPGNFDADADQLFENLGDGRFAEITIAGGINDRTGKGLGVVIADFDGDGLIDIYVSNDGTPNQLYHNCGQEKIRFEEIGLLSGVALGGDGVARAGMGIACADLHGHHRLDLYVTNFYDEVNTLYRNDGHSFFSDVTNHAGLAEPTRKMLGFGTQAIDFNLDGWPDLLIANGHIGDFRDMGIPLKMHPQLFVNRQDGIFAERRPQTGDYFNGTYIGRGVARCDWNNDGRPDALVVHQDRPVALLTNAGESKNVIVIRLIGRTSNRDAIGARVIAQTSKRIIRADLLGGDGFLCTNSRTIFIGLDRETAATVDVVWPSGRQSTQFTMESGQRLTLFEPAPKAISHAHP